MNHPRVLKLRGRRFTLGRALLVWLLAAILGVAIAHATPTAPPTKSYAIVFDKSTYRPHQSIHIRFNGLPPRVPTNYGLLQQYRYSFDQGCTSPRYVNITDRRLGVTVHWEKDIFTIEPAMRGRLGSGRHTMCLYAGEKVATATFTLLR